MTDLRRRLVAELLGSALLAAVVVGSGIAATQLSPSDVGLQLLQNAAATAAGLFALILMFGPVSGAHFNPVVTLADAGFGGLPWRTALAYVPTQVLGCIAGAVLANVMFAGDAVSISAKDRMTGAHFVAEVVATAGLVLLIFSLVRSGRVAAAPAAVGAYIGAAYFFTSSTSFANPAITVGRMFSDTFAGIAPGSAPGYVVAQLVGGTVGFAVVRLLYPNLTPAAAAQAVIPVETLPVAHPGVEMSSPFDPHAPGQPELLMPQAQLSRTSEKLARRFEGVFSPQTVERYVFESYTALRRTAKVNIHLTSLAERFAADRLAALAQSQGAWVKDVPEVLFLCVHNAGRSQLAAALLDHHARGRVHVRSAGSAPAGSINPIVVQAMAELGIDLDLEFPKPLTDDVVAAADCVVTMGCGDACPIHPGKRYLDWALEDPDGQDLDAVRRIRDNLDARVQVLLRELTEPALTPETSAPGMSHHP